MEIVNVEQLSPEWWKLKEKRMTASHAQAIGANGKGLETYINKLMQEYYSNADPEHFSNHHTERGTELEDSAGFVYQMETGMEVSKIGFVIYNDYVGASPDLFVGDDGMAEIKCLADKGYFDLLMGAKPDTKYIWQANMQLLVCEKKWNDLVFYNQNFDEPLIIIRVEPDHAKFEKLEAGFESGIVMIQEIENKMNKILSTKQEKI